MQAEIAHLNSTGFKLKPPSHCVSANYNITLKKHGYTNRHNRFINPYRLGFKNEQVETHFNFPYEAIGIDEAQKYLNSRRSASFPEWQSRWYEQHGHQNIDVFLATQRPDLIDVNVRELASFVEIREMKVEYNSYGHVASVKWTIREISSAWSYNEYKDTKRHSDVFEERTITAPYNIFKCYDHQGMKPKFYAGNMNRTFDIKESERISLSKKGFKKALETFDDEIPKNFYST